MKLMKTIVCCMIMLTFSLTAVAQTEKLPAFPGAEGFGRYTTGGRGGNVYHVTRLTNAGTGSLRWALNQPGPRTIVFDVSGTIHLTSDLTILSNTTIAGQTAPGDGICVADRPISMGGNNIIVRYMRFRLGSVNAASATDSWDGFGGYDQADWVIDHCSVCWSFDECLSVLGNRNTTVQWTLVSQSLFNVGHSKGEHGYGGNWGGSGASFHHNLIMHHSSRTPRLGPRPTTQLDERMDMRNNVIYNWGGNGCYGGEGMDVNIVNNYYKPGPATPTNNKGKRIAGIGVRTNSYISTYPAYTPALHKWGHFYVTGNVNSKYSDVTNNNWTIGVINQVDASGCDGTFTQVTKDTIKLTEPIRFIKTSTHTAAEAYQKVLAYVGASLHRDSYDERMVADARNGVATYTGSGCSKGFINTENDNKPAGAGSDWSAWPTLNSEEAPKDTDGDGMPDEWETANGLNPNDKSDGNATTLSPEGYTNLEVYMNSIVAEITEMQNEGAEMMGDFDDIESEANRTAYEICQQTSNGDWSFYYGLKIIGQSGTPAMGSNSCIKLSAKQYTISLPADLSINKVKIEGYCNASGATGYISEVAGNTFESTEYPLRDNQSWEISSHTITLPESAKDKLTFTTSASSQVCLKLTLYTENGSTAINTIHAPQTVNDDTIYNLQGVSVKNPTKGIYIQNGKKVVVK